MNKRRGLFIFFAAVTLAIASLSGCVTFQSIELTPPEKTVFGQGEEFTYSGLQVIGTTKKGKLQNISGDRNLKVTGYNPDRTGEQTITVGHRGVTASYTVTVAGVESIAIAQQPAAARQGMDIDRAALRVTASYGDKLASRTVQGSDPRIRISGYNKDNAGAQSVTVDYYGKSAVFDIKVAALTGIRVTTPPDKVTYLSGDPLDLTGIKVTGTWEGAGDAPVTPAYVSGFNPARQGNQTVVIQALGKQASFTVTVKEPADPITWTPAQGGFARHIVGIAFGNGTFVAAGYNDDKPNEGIIAYSKDGINWIKTSAYLNFKIAGLFFGGGKFIVTGYNTEKGAGYLSESSDGIIWPSPQSPSDFSGDCTGFAYGKDKQGKGIWVMTLSSGRIFYSTGGSGISWARALFRNSPSLDETWSISGVLFDGSRFITFDRSGRYIYSTDGHWWDVDKDAIAFGGRPVSGVIFGRGKWIGAASDNTLVWSIDGTTWTAADRNAGGRGDITGIAYGFGMFIAVNNRGRIIYSRDGFAWTQVYSSTFGDTAILGAAYGNGKFVAVGENGRIAYSNMVE